jgi:putative membrane protein
MNEQRISDHLANERTFLAWVRTGIGIMAFGFVVVKFSLFVKQISLMLGSQLTEPVSRGYSSVMGIVLVGFGVLITLLAFMRYKRVERQITEQDYIHSSVLVSILMAFLFLSGIALVIYLIHSI